MWPIESFSVRDVELDYGAAGPGRAKSKALYAEDVRLADALTCTDLRADPLKVQVCPQCGYAMCDPDGWVALRRTGDLLLFLPAFQNMRQAKEDDFIKYVPPDYIASRGAAYFDVAAYRRLREVVPEFPPPENIAPFTIWDALCLLQLEAPLKALGQFPATPRLTPSSFTAVDPGEVIEACEAMQGFLAHHANSTAPVIRIAAERRIAPVTFYLDVPGFPEWRPVARMESGQFCVLFEPDLRFAVAAVSDPKP